VEEQVKKHHGLRIARKGKLELVIGRPDGYHHIQGRPFIVHFRICGWGYTWHIGR